MKKYILFLIILLASFLRLYKLGSVPPSLYWDEASLGYNAYSILTTGHDEHGRFLPLTNFAAFGDYKPPGYIYATVPSIAVFGLNEFAIRFPSALFGILTVLLSYFLAKKLFENAVVALLTSFFLAISPWHLQFSRGAFEANLGLFFSTLGIYLFLKFAKDNPRWIFPSALSFVAAIYTFTGQRLFVPFILLLLVIQFRKQLLTHMRIFMFTTVTAAILFWPLFVFATKTIEGQLRFNEVTIFKDLEPINESIRYRGKDNYSWWADLIHNRRFFYAYQYLIHYFDAANPGFLFIRGDVNPRLSIQEVGELYLIDLPLILAGIYFLFSKKQKFRILIIGWLLVAPIGPATARETPHALRMISILPTFQLISAYGFFQFYKFVKFKKFFIVLVFFLLILNFLFYLHMYYLHWPKNYSDQWQYGYKQAVEAIKPFYNDLDYVLVTKSQGRPYIYFLLYLKYDPKNFWQTAQIVKDKFFFLDVNGFDKFRFADNPNEIPITGKVLYVTSPGLLPPDAGKITTIKRLDNLPVFDIGEVAR